MKKILLGLLLLCCLTGFSQAKRGGIGLKTGGYISYRNAPLHKFKLEIKYNYSSMNFFGLNVRFHEVDFLIGYRWKRSNVCSIYSGISTPFEIITVDGYGYNSLEVYTDLVPIGIEIFPFKTIPNIGITAEIRTKYFDDSKTYFGIAYHFMKGKK